LKFVKPKVSYEVKRHVFASKKNMQHKIVKSLHFVNHLN